MNESPNPAPVNEPDEDDEYEEIEEPEPAPVAPALLPDWMQGFAQAILPYVEEKIKAKADRKEILDLIERHAVKREVIEIHDRRTNERRDVKGYHHPKFKRLLQQLEMGLHTMLVGPCASGKTTEIRAAFAELGYTLYLQGPVASKYELLGHIDAAGNYHPTPFQRWFTSKEPAGLIWDEFDGNDSNAILPANPALENGICEFPYAAEPVEIGNPLSVACASANTWLLGKTDDFVGRCRQDAAAADRWTFIHWDYDNDHERAIAGNDAWTNRVQAVRAKAKLRGLKVVISPRASIRGAKMLKAGWPQAEVEQILLRKSLSDADWSSIQ
jgi:hypothetical protein